VEERIHKPVLLKEVIELLNVQKNKNYIDCTVGEGGHTIEILKKNAPRGRVLGFEIDRDLYEKMRLRGLKRLILVNDSYSNLKKIVEREKFPRVCGILADLGISSWHLEKSGRGFTFRKDEPLIMKYNFSVEISAMDVVNEFSQDELERIFKEYGNERFAKKIASEIVKERKKRKIERTLQLVEIIKRAVPRWYLRRKIHFATKTFLALRIVVNRELENVRAFLPQATDILEKKGRLAVISFHSLEDKIVKNFLREKEREGILRILTKKPIVPSKEEIIQNPRSRSAKLRVALKIK